MTRQVTDLPTTSLLRAATTLRTRYLAIFELQLEAVRRPVGIALVLLPLLPSAAPFYAGRQPRRHPPGNRGRPGRSPPPPVTLSPDVGPPAGRTVQLWAGREHAARESVVLVKRDEGGVVMAEGGRTGGASGAPFGGVYLMTIVGAAVYFVGTADGFWEVVLALLKAIVWPSFAVYRALELLNL